MDPPPNLLLKMYKGSRKIALNLIDLLIKLSEVARRTSGSVESPTQEYCEYPNVCKLLFTVLWTAYGSHGRVEPRRTNSRRPRYEQKCPIPEYRWILTCRRRHHAVRGRELPHIWSLVPMEGPKK